MFRDEYEVLSATSLLQTHPFDIIRVDFVSPLITKYTHKQKVAKFQSYVCLYLFHNNEHRKLVFELHTAEFLAAVHRLFQKDFVRTRSFPAMVLISRQPQDTWIVELCRQEELQNLLFTKGVEWSFILLYAPHFGGLWESATKIFYKSIKFCTP